MRTASDMLEVLEGFKVRGDSFAFLVKCYRGPEDLKEEQWAELRAELGLEGKELDGLPFGPEWIAKRLEDYHPAQWAAESAWEYGSEHVSELFGDRVKLHSEGRSGGWAVLDGIDAPELRARCRSLAELERTREHLDALRAVLETREHTLAARLAREHGLPVLDEPLGTRLERWRKLQETGRARLLVLARECELGDFEDKLRSLEDLENEETEERIRVDSLARLGLESGDKLPSPEELEPEPDPFGLEETVSKLEDFASFAESMVLDFPRRIAWEYGANLFEPEWIDAERERIEREELEAQALARGDAVSELGHSATLFLVSFGQHGEPGPGTSSARTVLENALRALSSSFKLEETVSVRMRASGRRPAVPCAKCGEPVRFKWGSVETMCGECQCSAQ